VTLVQAMLSSVVLAGMLLGAAARGSAAQDLNPPLVSMTPVTGVRQSATVSATVFWCDDVGLDGLSRAIFFNGASRTTSFSYVNGTQGCGQSKQSTGTLTLIEGTNTFSATICDTNFNCGSNAATYTYGVWLTPHTQAVSVAPFSAKQAYTFTVQNPTPTSKQYTFTVSCSGTVSSCQTPATLTVGANSTVSDTVYYNSGAAGTTGSLSVTAKGSANPAIADQLTATVTVTTPAQQLVVSPLYTNYDNHRVDLCDAGCFTTRQAVSTVPYFSGGQPRSTTLVYDGDAVAVRPVLSVDARVSAGALVLQEYWLEAKDSTLARITFLNGDTTLRFAAPATTTSRVRLAGQFDAAALGWATGVYPVTLIVTAKYTSGATEAQTIGTKVLVVNERKSLIGRGWTVGGVSRVQTQGPDAMIAKGGGSAVFFRGCGTGCYSAPPGDFSRLRTTGSGTGQMFYNDFPDSSRAEYNYLGQLTRLITRTLDSTVFEYDAGGRLTKIYDPYLTNAGAHLYTQLQYGATGLAHIVEPSAIAGHTPRTTDVTVAADSTLQTFRDPDGISTQFGYDGSRRLSTVTNRRGDLTTLTYNATSWKLATTVSPSFPVDPRLYGANQTRQLTTTYRAWQTAAVPTTTTGTTPAPAVLTDTIRGAVTDAGGHVTAFTVNRWGQAMVTTVLPGSGLARVDSLFRDSLNVQVTKVRRHEGGIDTFGYTGPFLTSAQPAGQNAVTAQYGAFGQVTQISGTGIPTEVFKLGQRGRVDTAIVAGTYKTTYGYDSRQRVTSVTDAAGHTTTYHYDATFGTLDSTLAPGTRGRRVKFDTYGRDSASRAGTQPWQATRYDSLNRATMVTLEAAGGLPADTTLTAYDNVGNVLSVTDPAHHVYQYSYNALGALTQRTDPAGTSEKYFFDAEGAARSAINRRGDSLWADLDARHRPVAKTIKIGASVVRRDSLLYDPHGLWTAAHNAVSHDTVYTDSTGWTTKTAARLATDWTKAVQVRYTKDANSRLDTVYAVLPGSIAATWRRYAWNSSTGTLAAVNVNGASVSFTYNSDLLPDTIIQPGGLRRNLFTSSIHELYQAGYSTPSVDTALWRGLELDTLGRVARQYAWVNTDKRQYTYRYDQRGRLIAVHDSTLTGGTICGGVDFGWRICPGSYTRAFQWKDSLAYDRLGNATYANGVTGTGAATYDTTTNRITSWPGYTFAGDAAGNITQRKPTSGDTTTTKFYWSADGLLDSVIVGTRKIRYDYNAFGQLVRKRVDGDATATRHFFWDQGQLLAELDATESNRVGEYAYFPGTDRPVSFLTGATAVTATRYFQQDAQGSVIGLTTSAGGLAAAVSLSRPWGEFEDPLTIGDSVRVRWQGLFYEGDATQLYYVRTRWYDPVTHRFLTPDPIGLEGGLNPYTFAGNDPVNGSDPSGLKCKYFLDFGSFIVCFSPPLPPDHDHYQPGQGELGGPATGGGGGGPGSSVQGRMVHGRGYTTSRKDLPLIALGVSYSAVALKGPVGGYGTFLGGQSLIGSYETFGKSMSGADIGAAATLTIASSEAALGGDSFEMCGGLELIKVGLCLSYNSSGFALSGSLGFSASTASAHYGTTTTTISPLHPFAGIDDGIDELRRGWVNFRDCRLSRLQLGC
jgi:RHS repeat-associated protein